MGLPEGVSLLNTVGILAAVGIVTVMLRQLPFSALRLLKGSNLVGMLGMTMPVGVMTVLVVYTIAHQSAEPGGIWSSLIASAVTLAVHWWRRSAGRRGGDPWRRASKESLDLGNAFSEAIGGRQHRGQYPRWSRRPFSALLSIVRVELSEGERGRDGQITHRCVRRSCARRRPG